MKKRVFYFFLAGICLLGLAIRLIDYDRVPPWRESDDEIHYAWAGLTWITKGVPTSWSWLSAYPKSETYRAWDVEWRLVSPMLEKPPLYSWFSGGLELVVGHSELSSVRLSTIRLLPILLGVITIVFTGIAATKLFSPAIGILSALLYAFAPPIVMSNRLSVTENLITPLSLISLIIFLTHKKTPVWDNKQAVLLGLIGGMAILTKQIGITVIITYLILYGIQKKWKPLIIIALVGATCFLVYPLMGLYYDWQLFQAIQQEQRQIGLQGGLPQLVFTILSRPLITTEKLFPDGTILLGYLLLFTSPWWLSAHQITHPLGNSSIPPLRPLPFLPLSKGEVRRGLGDVNRSLETWLDWSKTVFLAFPFTYIAYLALAITGAEPIGSGQGFWGWYSYPLFPYVVILVAASMVKFWHSFSLFESLIVALILGSGAVRYVLLFLPREYHYLWQHAMIAVLFVMLTAKWLPEKFRRALLFFLLIIFIAVNIYSSWHLSSIYPATAQP